MFLFCCFDVCKCKCNLFTHGTPRSSQELDLEMSMHSGIELEYGNVFFLRRRENRSTRRKSSRSRVENQQQTQPTYDPWERGCLTPCNAL